MRKPFSMKEKERFALIGRTLKHSYSKIIHFELGSYPYDLVELEPNALKDFVQSKKYKGFNVTIPYKTDIIQYLDKIDESAQLIGAVNTVVNENGKLVGYNTDFLGMKYMLSTAGITLCKKTVMILGSGGTSKTARAVAKSEGAKEIIVVSRSGEVNYENMKTRPDTEIIINTTPVGMFPDSYNSPITLDGFNKLEGVADVIYNPFCTKLCLSAKQKGIKAVNGFYMLIAQAKYAMEKFLSKPCDDGIIEKVYDKLSKEKQNVVLIGMPGSGKSTVGKLLAEKLGRELIDTDQEIVKRDGRDIPTIFSASGEEYFRKLETEVLLDVGKLTGKVISTGGGIIKNSENLYPLKSNGKIFWIVRDVEKLVTDGRPLSKDLETVKKLFDERKGLYAQFADVIIDNNQSVENAVKGVMDKL